MLSTKYFENLIYHFWLTQNPLRLRYASATPRATPRGFQHSLRPRYASATPRATPRMCCEIIALGLTSHISQLTAIKIVLHNRFFRERVKLLLRILKGPTVQLTSITIL